MTPTPSRKPAIVGGLRASDLEVVRKRQESNLLDCRRLGVSNATPYHSGTLPGAEEGGGIEPLPLSRVRRFSKPVSHHGTHPPESSDSTKKNATMTNGEPRTESLTSTQVSQAPRPIEIRPMRNGWSIVGRSPCGCVVGAVYALTLKAAVWRYRFARGERWIVLEALGG